jgi:hypothetical protein
MTSAAHTVDGSECTRYDLSSLLDQDVLAGTRRLVGASNQLFADLLAHLAEVEARGIHRNKACASLYTYCIYELQFSEDAAFRRVSAARYVKAFPALFDAIASGELHLTGLLLIAPHLTTANQHEVLARAKHRTKKELAKLVRELDPLPDVPARIAPLGPAAEPSTHLRNPTWAEYAASMEPVRHLKAGERPRDWVDESTIAHAFEQAANATSVETAANGVAPARVVPTVTGPQRHAVQFTASQEYADLVARAKALLSHTGGTSLEELHLRAMQCLVAQLEKRKYGAPRRDVKSLEDDQLLPTNELPEPHTKATAADERSASTPAPAEPERSRNIPARIRRRVFERDGQHHADNLTLRCAAHNAMAAEQEFGAELIREERDAARHESLRSQHRFEEERELSGSYV